MNKKPGLLFAVSMLALIILAVVFDLNFGGNTAVQLRPGMNLDDVLYICPVAEDSWSNFAEALSYGRKYIVMFFSFALFILMFSWGWALYQNLLKDKFSADVYKNPWELTKIFFWAGVIVTVLSMTPNYFRTVEVNINHTESKWVLCENTSADARAVNAQTVTLR